MQTENDGLPVTLIRTGYEVDEPVLLVLHQEAPSDRATKVRRALDLLGERYCCHHKNRITSQKGARPMIQAPPVIPQFLLAKKG